MSLYYVRNSENIRSRHMLGFQFFQSYVRLPQKFLTRLPDIIVKLATTNSDIIFLMRTKDSLVINEQKMVIMNRK